MAGDEQAPGKIGGDAQVKDLDFDDIPQTSPAIDPTVEAAMESLRRVQHKTVVHVSDITELLKKKISGTMPAVIIPKK